MVFPPDSGPIEVALATSVDTMPWPTAHTGPLLYSVKADGWRLVINRNRRGVELRSRQGTNLTDRAPDLAASATTYLGPGTVVDGELVVFENGRFDWDALSRRMEARRRGTATPRPPVSYLAFDLLALDGQDLRTRPLTERWALLEQLSLDHGWQPPLQLVLQTADPTEAVEWFHALAASGSEGLVVKAADGHYIAGRRSGWRKLKLRDSTEVVVGAVLGSITQPEVLIVGRYTSAGELRIVGRTGFLSVRESTKLGRLLHAVQADGHPWPEALPGFFGSKPVTILHVQPDVVVEIEADMAHQAGRFRHTVRYIRHRPELDPSDLTEAP